jgi:hypothetical protein
MANIKLNRAIQFFCIRKSDYPEQVDKMLKCERIVVINDWLDKTSAVTLSVTHRTRFRRIYLQLEITGDVEVVRGLVDKLLIPGSALNMTLQLVSGICHLKFDLIYRPHNDSGRK